MQSTTVIMFVLVAIGILFVSTADGATCSCTCCSGTGCQMVEKPALTIPSCDNDACEAKCKQTYAADCAGPQSQSVTFCFSAGSIIFNRYTVFTAFLLAFISMKGLSF